MKVLKLFMVVIVTFLSVQTLYAQNDSWKRIWFTDEIVTYINVDYSEHQFIFKEEYSGNMRDVRAKAIDSALKVYKAIRIVEFNQNFTSYKILSATFYDGLDKVVKSFQEQDASWNVVESQKDKIEAREAKKLYDSEE